MKSSHENHHVNNIVRNMTYSRMYHKFKNSGTRTYNSDIMNNKSCLMVMVAHVTRNMTTVTMTMKNKCKCVTTYT